MQHWLFSSVLKMQWQLPLTALLSSTVPSISLRGVLYPTASTARPTALWRRSAPPPTKRGTTGDLEAHWQFVLEETVCGDFGQVCFSPQANLWVDYYANGASSPSQQLHNLYCVHSQVLTLWLSLLHLLGHYCRFDQ
jgi:hypothetical protein